VLSGLIVLVESGCVAVESGCVAVESGCVPVESVGFVEITAGRNRSFFVHDGKIKIIVTSDAESIIVITFFMGVYWL
jgi:hypothetical protein